MRRYQPTAIRRDGKPGNTEVRVGSEVGECMTIPELFVSGSTSYTSELAEERCETATNTSPRANARLLAKVGRPEL